VFESLGMMRGVYRFVHAAGDSSLNHYQYLQVSNEKIIVIIHIEGIKNLKEILTVEGL